MRPLGVKEVRTTLIRPPTLAGPFRLSCYRTLIVPVMPSEKCTEQ